MKKLWDMFEKKALIRVCSLFSSWFLTFCLCSTTSRTNTLWETWSGQKYLPLIVHAAMQGRRKYWKSLGCGHCVFKWILHGNFQPPINATISTVFEVIFLRVWYFLGIIDAKIWGRGWWTPCIPSSFGPAIALCNGKR